MPEGHTLHRLARRQQRVFGGEPVRVSSPQGRFAYGAAVVDGMVFAKAEAWGKHLIQHYRPLGTTGRAGRRMIHGASNTASPRTARASGSDSNGWGSPSTV